MNRARYAKQRARRLAEEEGIPYRDALRREGRRVAGVEPLEQEPWAGEPHG